PVVTSRSAWRVPRPPRAARTPGDAAWCARAGGAGRDAARSPGPTGACDTADHRRRTRGRTTTGCRELALPTSRVGVPESAPTRARDGEPGGGQDDRDRAIEPGRPVAPRCAPRAAA